MYFAGYGISTVCPSSTPIGLDLGPTNLGRTNLPQETLGLRRGRFSLPFSLLIPASSLVRRPALLTVYLHPDGQRSPTQTTNKLVERHNFGYNLSPVYCRRKRTRPVSYYALFQGWLLLSQPPGCFCTFTSLPTQIIIGDLSW